MNLRAERNRLLARLHAINTLLGEDTPPVRKKRRAFSAPSKATTQLEVLRVLNLSVNPRKSRSIEIEGSTPGRVSAALSSAFKKGRVTRAGNGKATTYEITPTGVAYLTAARGE